MDLYGGERRADVHGPQCNGMGTCVAVPHGPATDKTGFIYMLAGDTGASNTDPYATTKTADNHWIQTGSHVMIVGAAVKTMAGYAKMLTPIPRSRSHVARKPL